jgi:hypothetical protein
MKKTLMTGKNVGIVVNGQVSRIGENSMRAIFHFRTTGPKCGSGILN